MSGRQDHEMLDDVALKARIMRRVRGETAPPPRARRPVAARPPVWPAYLAAAACLVIALLSTISNIALTGQLRQARVEAASAAHRSSVLTSALAGERIEIGDLLGGDAKRYPVGNGEVVANASRLYIAVHDLPEPPRGKVYQAWTLAKGSTKMAPSVTFVPDARGVAIVALPVDARLTSVVAVSVESSGGSEQPTSKPVIVVPLT